MRVLPVGITLLTGGARSGKSSLAVELGRAFGGAVTVVVTARAGDDEMAERIERHRAERPREWATIEEPEALLAALRDAREGALVIVDCLTLWTSNLVEAGLTDTEIESHASDAAHAASRRTAPVIAVTNEVGSGIVPANELARRFRDVHGRVNALWARSAASAYLVVAGRVVPLEAIGAR